MGTSQPRLDIQPLPWQVFTSFSSKVQGCPTSYLHMPALTVIHIAYETRMNSQINGKNSIKISESNSSTVLEWGIHMNLNTLMERIEIDEHAIITS